MRLALWPPRRRLKKMLMTRSVLQCIRDTVGKRPAEAGGMLGGSLEDGVVRHFHFDASAQSGSASYTPDVKLINKVLATKWNPVGIRLLGFVHSHPAGCLRPSGGDLVYARRILDHNLELQHLLLPIVMTGPDTGRFEIMPYAAVRDHREGVRIEKLDLVLVESTQRRPLLSAAAASFSELGTAEPPVEAAITPAPAVVFSAERSMLETFCRVREAYDLRRMAYSRIIYVGVGGAASFAEEMARTGLSEHVLIDPDVVSESNLATQQVYRRDLGRPKVECVAERIRDINPHAVVLARQEKLEDLNDAEFRRLTTAPMRQWTVEANGVWGLPDLAVPVQVTFKPAVTLLCGFTDNFESQARVNRLALHLGVPSLCAQVYEAGRGAEITFTHPDTTPACHRCALSARYKAFVEDGFRNNVTSAGTPICSTTRLNGAKAFVALALLHYGTDHPRWGNLLQRIGNRNLVQIRMDPDLPLPVFERVFGAGDQGRILFDEAVWLPQLPDCPASGFPTCPDCGGTGDLRAAIGTFADTRVMRT